MGYPNTIEISEVQIAEHKGELEISASIGLDKYQQERVYYAIPINIAPVLTLLADPFLIPLVLPAMRLGARIEVKGEVSEGLLENLEEFQVIWHFWRPDKYDCVPLNVHGISQRAARQPEKAVLLFSGGVDGCASLYRHSKKLIGRRSRNIGAGLFVHGSDIPVSDTRAYSLAAERNRRMVDDLGINLLQMRTNWRQVSYGKGVRWLDWFGSVLAGCASIFKHEFGTGMLASGDSYYNVRPHGSNPLTDRLFSSSEFSFSCDGAELRRLDKIALVSNWRAALDDLRVCWEGEDHSKNCGRCEKCVRTILGFWAMGLSVPRAFTRDVGLDDISAVRIRNHTQLREFQAIYQHCVNSGQNSEKWVIALGKRIAWEKSIYKRAMNKVCCILDRVTEKRGRGSF